ncbi:MULTISPECIES: serine/threonine-protein kinase [unclassified Coleofasciculus]|uniref:serine/threonine-protein kinase n=1 Tax=unclassified Coleofasciculus TaxID=2692782 RepID=UPI001882A8D9|nr:MULTISPECIES: serine/threonine-protein kinase [unclassified Coleofasciculus]MBE9124623.1 protein kinase [Coleofasciculus sp. LEGE 07081]MBE9147587.1 protein kinase [Coleofasciculus sp. LEGE 07092]
MNSIACTSCEQTNPRDARFCSRCGATLPKPSLAGGNLTPGTRLRDRYIICHPLGRGGFSRTYLAEDTGRFNDLVTIKELTPATQETYILQKAEELFQREAAILHKLSSPQIPRFWEFFREGKRLFLVQDYIEGKTYQVLLEERLAAGQTLSEAEIVQLLQQLLPVVSYLHSYGIIHRDIAPDNIICRTADGLPILIDLGGVAQVTLKAVTTVVRETNSSVSSSGTRLGKVGYAPDEQLRLGIVAPHSDLYALGVTILVLMTGKQPPELLDPNTLEWRWMQELNLSQPMSNILHRMLAPQPCDRFQSVDELLQELPAAPSGFPATQLTNTVAADLQEIPNQSAPTNDSGTGHIFDESFKVPDEIKGWNWGAFWLPGFWCLTNQVWVGLISWADLSLITLPVTFGTTWPIVGVVLGVKGNEWAWKSRRWRSIKDFKRHQRFWAIASWVIVGSFAALLALIFALFLIGMVLGMGSMGGMGGIGD